MTVAFIFAICALFLLGTLVPSESQQFWHTFGGNGIQQQNTDEQSHSIFQSFGFGDQNLGGSFQSQSQFQYQSQPQSNSHSLSQLQFQINSLSAGSPVQLQSHQEFQQLSQLQSPLQSQQQSQLNSLSLGSLTQLNSPFQLQSQLESQQQSQLQSQLRAHANLQLSSSLYPQSQSQSQLQSENGQIEEEPSLILDPKPKYVLPGLLEVPQQSNPEWYFISSMLKPKRYIDTSVQSHNLIQSQLQSRLNILMDQFRAQQSKTPFFKMLLPRYEIIAHQSKYSPQKSQVVISRSSGFVEPELKHEAQLTLNPQESNPQLLIIDTQLIPKSKYYILAPIKELKLNSSIGNIAQLQDFGQHKLPKRNQKVVSTTRSVPTTKFDYLAKFRNKFENNRNKYMAELEKRVEELDNSNHIDSIQEILNSISTPTTPASLPLLTKGNDSQPPTPSKPHIVPSPTLTPQPVLHNVNELLNPMFQLQSPPSGLKSQLQSQLHSQLEGSLSQLQSQSQSNSQSSGSLSKLQSHLNLQSADSQSQLETQSNSHLSSLLSHLQSHLSLQSADSQSPLKLQLQSHPQSGSLSQLQSQSQLQTQSKSNSQSSGLQSQLRPQLNSQSADSHSQLQSQSNSHLSGLLSQLESHPDLQSADLQSQLEQQSQSNLQSSGSLSQLQSQSQSHSQSSELQSQLQSQLNSQSADSHSQLPSQSNSHLSGLLSQLESHLNLQAADPQSQSEQKSQSNSQSSGSLSQMQSQLHSQLEGSLSQLQSQSQSNSQTSGSLSKLQSQLNSLSQLSGLLSQLNSHLSTESADSQSQLQSQSNSDLPGLLSQLQSHINLQSAESQSQLEQQSQPNLLTSGSPAQMQSQLNSQSSGSQSQSQTQQSKGSPSQLQPQSQSHSLNQLQSQIHSQSEGLSQLESQLQSQQQAQSNSQSQSQLNAQSLGSLSQSQSQSSVPFIPNESLQKSNNEGSLSPDNGDLKITVQYNPNNPPKFFSQADILDDSKLTTVHLIEKYGYPSETVFVNSDDGYKLCLHRIPRPGAQPVLLVHGLMASSASWVELGPSNGLAYILYRKGYDVWMLNTRGNIYSRGHVGHRPKRRKYWDFSFHEIGKYDVPAAIDLILSRTMMPQLQYIGHSQGSTVFFVMCSERPEYATKVQLMQALSPTVYLQENRSPVLQFLSMFKGKYSMLLNLLGGYKISSNTKLIQQFRQYICSSSELDSRICAIFDFVLCGFDWKSFNETLTPIVAGHASQGASAKQILHYAQMQGDLVFQHFDHGPVLNLIRYESRDPPAYNLSQATSHVVLHHGAGDWLGSDSDVARLEEQLPNLVESHKVNFDGFSHFDFTLSKDVQPLVYSYVLQHMSIWPPDIPIVVLNP